jgi:hypothetical protein
MAKYLFLDDGRRVEITDGFVTLFPDDGFNFREAMPIGHMEYRGNRWLLKRGGRDAGSARSKKEGVLRLMDDAADDIASRMHERQAELARFHDALAAVQELLPNYRASPEPFGPYLVFKPEEVLTLLAEAEALGFEAEGDEDYFEDDPPFEAPSGEMLDELAEEHLGVTFADDPEAIVKLAVVGLTNYAWRNTPLEDLHAGDHPGGGFPDTDMMRYNIATTRAVASFIGADRINWLGLRNALTDPDRALPGGLTVGELAGDEFDELASAFDGALSDLHTMERHHGVAYALTRLALVGGMSCKEWFGTPWWEDLVDVFTESLADPSSKAWSDDDGRSPVPTSAIDRNALRAALLTAPETLDDDGVRWCWRHGLRYRVAYAGFARWRTRRDPSWVDPTPPLAG